MKKIFLLVAFLLQAIQGQSVSLETTNPLHILKEEVLVLEYEYTSEVVGFVESALNLYNEEDILKKTIISEKKASVIGDNIVDVISLELPEETETTNDIAANDHYRIAIQLSDSKGERLAGVEELIKEVQSTNSIEFSGATAFTATTGSSEILYFSYTSDIAATVSVALNLYDSGGVYKQTVNYNSADVIAGTNIPTSIVLDIPSDADLSTALADGDYYKFVIELKNGVNWLAGDYPITVVTLQQGNSISFDTPLTSSATTGETIDINYTYSSSVAASVSVALNLYDSGGSYKETVNYNSADVIAGTAVSTSIALDIPSDAVASTSLSDGDYYKFVIELKNGDTWLSGDYPGTVVTLQQGNSISFDTPLTSSATTGETIDINYTYNSSVAATVSVALNLYDSGGVFKQTVNYNSADVIAGTAVPTSIALDIPSDADASTALADGDYYKFVIELKNGDTWMSGDYPSTAVTLEQGNSISFTEFPPSQLTAGLRFDISYSYFSNTDATVSCSLSLCNSDGSVKENITSFSKEVVQVTEFSNELISLTIPSSTYIAPTADLESGEYYKFIIALIGQYIDQTYQYVVDEDEFIVTGTSLSGGEAVKKYNTISVYPNPSSESLKIEGFTEGEKLQVQVFDITGMQVLKQQLETPIIDISRLKTGMYIFRVTNGSQHKTLKFSKKN